MITIIIKSFNRPYYLDRCLKSIELFVAGNFAIKVLDDGTPEKYLEKIQSNHPQIEIKLSHQHVEKRKAIHENLQNGKEINGFQIPTDLWVQSVRESTDYVLVIEDDVWFSETIDLQKIVEEMHKFKISLVKLGWLGNYSDDKNLKISAISPELDRTIPEKLITGHEFVMDMFMYNKFKFFTILYKLGYVTNETKRKYWALNSILMGLYHKDYWLQIWKDAIGKVDEKQQLRNAATTYHKNKSNPNFIARTKKEFLRTTFQSSATNSYHQYGFSFDVDYFNFKINESWYKDQFDVMQNFPRDFSMNYLEEFFDDKLNIYDFRNWVRKFKEQYRNLGAKVD